MAFSCVHYGDTQGHDADLWGRFLTKLHLTENAIAFGLGDYLDPHRTTHRIPLSTVWGEDEKARTSYDQTILETYVHPFVDRVKKLCPDWKKKIFGLIEGNHHGTLLGSKFSNGWTTTQEICKLLDIRYLGLSAWVRLNCVRSESKGTGRFGTSHNLNILLNHSTSSSGKLSPSLASAERKLESWRGVDIFFSANDHQLGHVLKQRIGCTNRGEPHPVEFQQVIGKVGSFQKGYQVGAQHDNYVEKKFLHPGQLGWLEFDAHIYHRSNPEGASRVNSPEVWRFTNFSV